MWFVIVFYTICFLNAEKEVVVGAEDHQVSIARHDDNIPGTDRRMGDVWGSENKHHISA